MAHHETGRDAAAPHVMPLGTYFAVFLALMAGTALTVVAAYVDLGWANNAVALAIAITKATLVILFFMHVKENTRLIPAVILVRRLHAPPPPREPARGLRHARLARGRGALTPGRGLEVPPTLIASSGCTHRPRFSVRAGRRR